MAYTDGTFTSAKQIGPKRLSYPFLNNPVKDTTTVMTERDYYVLPANYTPAAALSTDPDNNVSYLVQETPPQVDRGVYRLTRTYCNIPGNQVIPSSRMFVRPSMHDIAVNGVYAVSFDDNETSHLFTARKAVVSIGAAEATYLNPTNSRASTGHYQVTVELNNSSQSFYLDDSDTTIKNALSNAFIGSTANAGNFYISRWTFGVYISWAGITVTTKAITVADSEITVSDRTVALGVADSNGPIEFVSAQTTLTSIRAVTSTSHGGAAGNRVALYNNDRIIAASTVITTDTNYFTINTADLPDADAVVTHCVFNKDGIRVVNGPKDCSARTTERYYLPGVTAGVTTAADIPSVPVYADPLGWLGRLTATTHANATCAEATNKFTVASHGIATGETFFLSAIGSGAGGLSAMTQYFAIYSDANTFYAANSPANAFANSAINITTDGTGINIVVPDPWPEIATSDLKQWMGPYLMKATDEVQMADALETRGATA